MIPDEDISMAAQQHYLIGPDEDTPMAEFPTNHHYHHLPKLICITTQN